MQTIPTQCYANSTWWAPLGLNGKSPCDILNDMRNLCIGEGTDATLYQQELSLCIAGCLCSETVYAMYGACTSCTYQDAATAQASVFMRTYAYWSTAAAGVTGSTTPEDFSAQSPEWTSKVNFTDTSFNVQSALAATEATSSSSSATFSTTSVSISPLTSSLSSGLSTTAGSLTPSISQSAGSSSTQPPSTSHQSSAPVAAIAGGVAGGIGLLALIAALVYCIKIYSPHRIPQKAAPYHQSTQADNRSSIMLIPIAPAAPPPPPAAFPAAAAPPPGVQNAWPPPARPPTARPPIARPPAPGPPDIWRTAT